MFVNFDDILDRVGTNCKRWDNVLRQYPSKPIPMGIADMDFSVPVEIIEAIKQRLDHPCFGYTYPSEQLKFSIVSYIEKKYGWIIDPKWIIFYPDATTSLYFIFNGLKNIFGSRDQVVLQPPVFSSFFNDIKRAGLQTITNPLLFDNNQYFMDFNHLDQILTENSKILSAILCNPQNPIGRVWNKDELEKIGDICCLHKCPVISDELHSDLILPNHKHIPIASLSTRFEQNSITLYSPGKGFNMAGLKIAIAVIPNEEIRNAVTFVTNNMDPNVFSMIAYETILNLDPERYTIPLVNYLQKNFNYVDHFLKTKLPALKLVQPQATFLAWIDMNGLNLSPIELEQFMLEKANILTAQGYLFGQGGEGFLRFNIGMPLAKLKQALEQLEHAIKIGSL